MLMWLLNSNKSTRYTRIDDCEGGLLVAFLKQQESDTQEKEFDGEYISINGLEYFDESQSSDESDSLVSDEEQTSITKKEKSDGKHSIIKNGSDETIATDDADWPDITIYVIMLMVIAMIIVILFNNKNASPKHPIDLTPIPLTVVPIMYVLDGCCNILVENNKRKLQ